MSPEQRLALAERLWGWEPHPGQREFLTLRLDDGSEPGTLVAACGRRWGKTNALAVDCACRLLTEPDLAQLLVGPTRDQAEGLFEEIAGLLDDARERKDVLREFPTLKRLEIKRSPYCHIRVKGVAGRPMILSARSAGRNGRNLRGKGTTRKQKRFRVVVDEAAYVPDAAIEEAILPMLATVPGGGGQLVMISSPAGRRGAFYKAYQRGEQQYKRYRSVRLPSSQNPLVDTEYLAEMQADMTDRRFRSEFLAEFVESDGQVFADVEIAAAVLDDDSIERSPLPGAVYVAGVDFGRRGDYTVVIVGRVSPWGIQCVHMARLRGLTWAAQIEQVADVLQAWGVKQVTVDRTGVGDAVAETLNDAIIVMRLACILSEFVFTQVSKRVLVDGLSLALSQKRLQFPGWPDLLGELQAFEVLAVSVTGNERTGAAGDAHDDTVMALGLCREAGLPWLAPGGQARADVAAGEPRRNWAVAGGSRNGKDLDFSWPGSLGWQTRQPVFSPGFAGLSASPIRAALLRLLGSAYRFGVVRRAVAACTRLFRNRGTPPPTNTRPEG